MGMVVKISLVLEALDLLEKLEPMPKSPNLNPIENLWHKLKTFIGHVTKPKIKQELVYRWLNGLLGDCRCSNVY